MFNFTKPQGPLHPDIRRAIELLWDHRNPSSALASINATLLAAGYSRPPTSRATSCFRGTAGVGGDGTSLASRSHRSSPSAPPSASGGSRTTEGSGGDLTADKRKGTSSTVSSHSVSSTNKAEVDDSKGNFTNFNDSVEYNSSIFPNPARRTDDVEEAKSGVAKRGVLSGTPIPAFASSSNTFSTAVGQVKGVVVSRGTGGVADARPSDLSNTPPGIIRSTLKARNGGCTEAFGLPSSSCGDHSGGVVSGGSSSSPATSSSTSGVAVKGKPKENFNALQLERLLLLKADALAMLTRHQSSLQEALAAVEVTQGSSPLAYFTVGRQYRFLWSLDEAVLAFQKGETIVMSVLVGYARACTHSPSGRGWSSTQFLSFAYWNKEKKRIQDSPLPHTPVSTEIGVWNRQEDGTHGLHALGSQTSTPSLEQNEMMEEENDDFWASEGFSPEEVKEIGMSKEEYQWQQDALQRSRDEVRQQKAEQRGMQQMKHFSPAATSHAARKATSTDRNFSSLWLPRSGEEGDGNSHEGDPLRMEDGSKTDTMQERNRMRTTSEEFSSLSEDDAGDPTGTTRLARPLKEGGDPHRVGGGTPAGSRGTPLSRPHASSVERDTAVPTAAARRDRRMEGDATRFSYSVSFLSSVSSLSDAELLSLLGMDQYELSIWRRHADECRALLAVNISQTIPTTSFSAALTTLWPKVESVRNGVIVAIENSSHETMCFVGATFNGGGHLEGYTCPPVIPKDHTGIVLLQTTSWSGYHGTLCFELENSLCCFFYFDIPMLSSKKVGVRLLEHRAADLRLAFDEANGEANKGVGVSAAATSSIFSSGNVASTTSRPDSRQGSSHLSTLDSSDTSPHYSPLHIHSSPSPMPSTTRVPNTRMHSPARREAATLAGLQAVKIPSQSVWLSAHSAHSSHRHVKVFGKASEGRLVHFVVAEVPSSPLQPIDLITALEYAGPEALKKLSVVNRACRTLVNHFPPLLFRSAPSRNSRPPQGHNPTNAGNTLSAGGGPLHGGTTTSVSPSVVGNSTPMGSSGAGVSFFPSKTSGSSVPVSSLGLPCAVPTATFPSGGSSSTFPTAGASSFGAPERSSGTPSFQSSTHNSRQVLRCTSYPDYLLLMDRYSSPWVVRDRNVIHWRVTSEPRAGDRVEHTVMDMASIPALTTTHSLSSTPTLSSSSLHNAPPSLLTIVSETQSRSGSIVYGDHVQRRTVVAQIKEHWSLFLASALHIETPSGILFASVTSTSQGNFDLIFPGYGTVTDKVQYMARKQTHMDHPSSCTENGAVSNDSANGIASSSTPNAMTTGTSALASAASNGKASSAGVAGNDSSSTAAVRLAGKPVGGVVNPATRPATGVARNQTSSSTAVGKVMGDSETLYSIWRPRRECGASLLNGPPLATNSGLELMGEIVVFSSLASSRHTAADMKLYPGADGLLVSILCYAILRW